MAEDHLKRSASFGSTRRDDPSFEEDPLIELARIVAEDGGFRRHRPPELRPARNEPGRHDRPSREEAIASQLEAELMENWEAVAREADLPERRPVTEIRAPGATSQAEPAHVPLRAAVSGEPRRPTRFPEIVIEDARPSRAASGGRSEHWLPERRPPREEITEPFEEELHALLSDPEVSQVAEEADGFTDEGATEVPLPQYEDSYADSYSAEIYELEPAEGVESGPDEFLAEQDTSELSAIHREPARARRSYKGLIAAVGVLGVVIMGGAVAALVGGVGGETDGGPPPVIRAEAGPAKIQPEETADASASDGAGQAVYDRVAGRAPKSDEKLVDRAEEPRQVSRVVLPQAADTSQADEASGDEIAAAEERPGGATDSEQEGASSEESIAGRISSETSGMQSGPQIAPVGPRRVRTVTVRPDGSIIADPEPVRVAEAASQPLGQIEADFATGNAPDPVPVRTVTIGGDSEAPSRSLQSEPAESQSESAAAPQLLAPTADSRQPEPAVRDGGDGASADGAAEAGEPVSPTQEQIAMLPRARPDDVPAGFVPPAGAQAPESQQAATRPAASRGSQPVDLLAAGPASPRSQAQQARPPQQAPRSASPSGSSPYAVQISAQRSDEQARATFASLKNQFPSILGSHEPQIERADLGDRGIYYRVRIGAGSQSEAVQLCEQLKAAGGSCFVAR